MRDEFQLDLFINESLLIEGITGICTHEELTMTEKFLDANEITIPLLSEYVNVFTPNNVPRFHDGLDVRIGNFFPPAGGVFVRCYLESLLGCINTNEIDPFTAHARYEWLHPYTDGNGRSGRALWLWLMQKNQKHVFNSSFLHTFYYQTLDNYQKRLSPKGVDIINHFGTAA